MEKHNEFWVKKSVTHTNSLVKIRQDPILRSIHQNPSLQTLSKNNRQTMCSYYQKFHFVTQKCIKTMKCIMDVPDDATTLRKEQGHLKCVKKHEMTLDMTIDMLHNSNVAKFQRVL